MREAKLTPAPEKRMVDGGMSGAQQHKSSPIQPVSFGDGIVLPRPRGIAQMFLRRHLPSEESCRAIVSGYHWLLENLGGLEELKASVLALPTDEFFPVRTRGSEDAIAEELFDAVADCAGLGDWSLELVRLGDDPDTVDLMGKDFAFGSGAGRRGSVSALGYREDGTVIVSYAPHLLQHPEKFIAAMAYELVHAMVLAAPVEAQKAAPLDPVRLVEVGVHFFGFGVFAANSVFNMEGIQETFTIGWQTSSLGTLSEREVSYALALFLALREEDAGPALKHLKPNPRAYVKGALRVFQKDGKDLLEQLRSIEPKEPESDPSE